MNSQSLDPRQLRVDPATMLLIEKVVHDEAANQGPEGRDAVRAVVYNRVAADKKYFGGSNVVNVLNHPKQFQGVMEKGKGDVRNLAIPSDLQKMYMQEHLDFLNKGVDPTNGATFFQNPGAAKNRYKAEGGLKIGDHVFYDNYQGNKVAVPQYSVALQGFKRNDQGVPQVPTPLFNAADVQTIDLLAKAPASAPQATPAAPAAPQAPAPTQPAAPQSTPETTDAAATAENKKTPRFSMPAPPPPPKPIDVPLMAMRAPQSRSGQIVSQAPGAQINRQMPPSMAVPGGPTMLVDRPQGVSRIQPVRMAEGGMVQGFMDPLPQGYVPKGPEDRQGSSGVDTAMTALDIATDFVPVVGEVKSAVDAYKEYQEGNYGSAALSALGAIPGVGMISRGVRAGKKASKAADDLFTPLAKASDDVELPPASNAQKTQIAGTLPTYEKAQKILDDVQPSGKTLDFGAGLGVGAKKMEADSYEPFAREGFNPTYRDSKTIPDNSYDRVTNLNVLNVVPRDVRDGIVKDIGRVLSPNGTAIITTRGKDVMTAKGKEGPEAMSRITSIGTYQKGFTPKELREYVSETLGEGFDVTNIKLGPAGVMVKKKPANFYSGGYVGKTEGTMKTNKFACGGMMAPEVIVGYEEDSGNAIPYGSTASEVADDVPAMLSEGEVVIPADVVRWHGLKHIMDMRMEAKMGLMAMAMEGQIQGPGYEQEEYEEDEEMEDLETPEGNAIEVSEPEMEEEEMEYEDEEDAEYGKEVEDDYVGDEEIVLMIKKDPYAFKEY